MLKRALISVSKKDGIIEFARGLANLGVEIVSTGGTARAIREAGIAVRDISDLTGFPEILDGRVKTLHPKVHGGLLGIRDNPSHQRQMAEQQISAIDLVVVNLYPFEETAAKPGIEFDEVIENIDIGGPSMIRSAAKNFRDVGVVVDPADYHWVLEELKQNPSGLSLESRFRLARKAFNLTAGYDAAIASHLFQRQHEAGKFELNEGFPQKLLLSLDKVSDLRYGENPHQRAAFYRENSDFATVLADAVQLQGKELSFNNLIDLNAAFQLSGEFESPCAVIIKHTNPCGVAISSQSVADAYIKARECDPLSAFGSVLGFNRTVDKETAREIALTFVEAVIAPDFAPEALSLLASKKELEAFEVSRLGQATAPSRLQAGGGRSASSGGRPTPGFQARLESCHQAEPNSRRGRRFVVCLESGEARQIECNCLCTSRSNRGHWRWTNESRGLRTNWHLEGPITHPRLCPRL